MNARGYSLDWLCVAEQAGIHLLVFPGRAVVHTSVLTGARAASSPWR